MVVAGTKHVHRARNIRRQRQGIHGLIWQPRIFNRWIGHGAGDDAPVLRCLQYPEAAADTKPDHANGAGAELTLERVAPARDHAEYAVVGQHSSAPDTLLV